MPQKTDEQAIGRELYRFVEKAPGLVYCYDLLPEKRFSYVSSMATKICGYFPDEFYADPDIIFKIVHPLDHPRFESLTSGNILNGEPLMLRWIRRDGKTIWTEHHVAYGCDNLRRIATVKGIAYDVTRLIELGNALHEKTEHYRLLFEDMHNGFAYLKMIFDRYQNAIDFIIIAVNGAFERQTGIKKEEIVGQRGTEVSRRIANTVLNQTPLYGKVALSGGTARYDAFSNKWYSVNVYSPKKGYVAILLEDMSERKAVETKLKRTRLELMLRTENLNESNTALKVVLKHQEEELLEYKQLVKSRVDELIYPYLEKLKKSAITEKQENYLAIIESNLDSIIQSFDLQINDINSKLSPTENQIVHLITANKTSSEILDILDISESTLFSYRKSIRAKLGIRNSKINLKSHLESLLHK